jgi:NAD-dependent SIR2 family protein deacetylase
MEYHVTIEMLDPPVGKIDTAYCVRCARMFERMRDTGTFYDSSLWPPLCRTCRQPVACAGVSAGDAAQPEVVFQCVVHNSERWVWIPAAERWTRSS